MARCAKEAGAGLTPVIPRGARGSVRVNDVIGVPLRVPARRWLVATIADDQHPDTTSKVISEREGAPRARRSSAHRGHKRHGQRGDVIVDPIRPTVTSQAPKGRFSRPAIHRQDSAADDWHQAAARSATRRRADGGHHPRVSWTRAEVDPRHR